MSVERIAGTFLQSHLASGQRFVLPDPGEMTNLLTIGQIIKCRILRHIEGSRYAAEIGGKEKVVDSSLSLKTGDLLHGRVVGLGDNIELERIHVPQAMPTSMLDVPSRIASNIFSRTTAETIVNLFTEYGASLSEKDAAVLNQALQTNPALTPTIYAALHLAKLELPFTLEKLDALTKALTADPRQPLFHERTAIYLAANATQPITSGTTAQNDITKDTAFARLLSEFADGSARGQTKTAHAAQDGNSGQDSDTDSQDRRGLGYELLNLQIVGSMGHRVATVPLVVDGQLIELNIGLVDQRESRQDQAATVHRHLVFTLDTQALGTIAVDGVLTGEHLQLTFNTEHPDSLDALEEHSGGLRHALQQAGFQTDAIRYDVSTRHEMPSAAWLAVRNVISNDCLDRWI